MRVHANHSQFPWGKGSLEKQSIINSPKRQQASFSILWIIICGHLLTLKGLGKIPIYKLSLCSLLCFCTKLITMHSISCQRSSQNYVYDLSVNFLPRYMVLPDLLEIVLWLSKWIGNAAYVIIISLTKASRHEIYIIIIIASSWWSLLLTNCFYIRYPIWSTPTT